MFVSRLEFFRISKIRIGICNQLEISAQANLLKDHLRGLEVMHHHFIDFHVLQAFDLLHRCCAMPTCHQGKKPWSV